ncbi:MAG: TfoX/Sxy family protein [Bacteroidota bacterium]
MRKQTEDLLFDRMRNLLLSKEIHWVEKKMMGGITFMVDDKMCFGTFQNGLLCRIDPLERDELLEREGADIIRQGGREMKAYVHVQEYALDSDEELTFWIAKCLEFNPKVKARKKR